MAYTRNTSGEITGITSKSGVGGTAASVVSGATWLGLGEANSGLTFGNAIVEGRTYDLDLRPLALTETGKSNAVLQKLTYAYDADDNVKSIADGVNSANSQSFVYDTLNRVTHASGAYGAYAWTYDNIGDRLSEQLGSLTPTNYAYIYGKNQLGSQSGAVTQSFAYTAAGSLASATPASGSASVFGYNQANQLSSASVPNQVPESLAYDYQGRQVTRTLAGSPATVYRFQYDPAGHLLEERTNTAAEADYVYLGDRPVAVIAPSAGTVNLLLDDRLGTPQKATSSTQAVVWSAGYTPFGYTYALAGTLQQNLRMPGQVADPNAGWYHNGWRDYMPTWGRYLQTDPIGLAGGMNTFGYALQNPLKFVDPKGTDGNGIAGMTGGMTPNEMQGAGAVAQYNEMQDKVTSQITGAVGVSGELSTIMPTSSGGGVYGINIQYVSGNGISIYYYTPQSVNSFGFMPGISAQANAAVGMSQDWTGLFNSAGGNLSIYSGSAFWDPNGNWIGISGGVGLGFPIGGAITSANYQYLFPGSTNNSNPSCPIAGGQN